MAGALLAVAGAVLLSWWSWRGHLAGAGGRFGAVSRAIAIAALLLLLFDPSLRARNASSRPIVLVDHSISMTATGGPGRRADSLAARLGDTVAFGELAPGLPGGRSMLASSLDAALASGRPVAVVTDGAIADAGTIPPDVLAETTVRVIPRAHGPDVAVTSVEGPTRLAAGDTLALRIGIERTADASDTAEVMVREGGTTLLDGVARFGTATRTLLSLRGALPTSMRGHVWLEVARRGAADEEPRDDLRWWSLDVTPTPGIVLLAETPDWDARFLFETLKDVADAPVRGYAQLQRGQWRRMDNLEAVTVANVSEAAKAADLLAVRGDVDAWRRDGKARLLWPNAPTAGDWYVAAPGLSPIAGAFAGVDPDSLPPATAILRLPEQAAWVGAVARQARRGEAIPVITGDTAQGRTVWIGAAGLYRWGFRGGATEQVWAVARGGDRHLAPVDPSGGDGQRQADRNRDRTGIAGAVPLDRQRPAGAVADPDRQCRHRHAAIRRQR